MGEIHANCGNIILLNKHDRDEADLVHVTAGRPGPPPVCGLCDSIILSSRNSLPPTLELGLGSIALWSCACLRVGMHHILTHVTYLLSLYQTNFTVYVTVPIVNAGALARTRTKGLCYLLTRTWLH